MLYFILIFRPLSDLSFALYLFLFLLLASFSSLYLPQSVFKSVPDISLLFFRTFAPPLSRSDLGSYSYPVQLFSLSLSLSTSSLSHFLLSSDSHFFICLFSFRRHPSSGSPRYSHLRYTLSPLLIPVYRRPSGAAVLGVSSVNGLRKGGGREYPREKTGFEEAILHRGSPGKKPLPLVKVIPAFYLSLSI